MFVVMRRSVLRFGLLFMNVLHAFDFILNRDCSVKSLDFRLSQSLYAVMKRNATIFLARYFPL